MRVLVIGGNSFIGNRLIETLEARGHRVEFTTRASFDMLCPEKHKLPDADVIYICAAVTRFIDCERFKLEAHRVNVDAPRKIAEMVPGAKLVFLSSEAVEEAPDTNYGRLKWRAEVALDRFNPVIVRLSKVTSETLHLCTEFLADLADKPSGLYFWPKDA